MDFKQLESFIEVIKLKSFSKAAEKLYLTQPTITNHIQILEKEIGTLLINRSNKELNPTEAGLILYKHALDVLNIRIQAELELNKYTHSIEGNLEINSSSVPKQYILPPLLTEFLKEHSDVTFSINNLDSESIAKQITNGYIDFGITGAKYPSSSLKYLKLMEDELVVIMPNSLEYKKYSEKEISFNQLSKFPLIMREDGSGSKHIFLEAIKSKGISPNKLNIIGIANDNETIKRFVTNNLGVGIISKNIIQNELTTNSLLYCTLNETKLIRNFYFVYHQNRHLTPLSETFKKFIIKKSNDIKF